MHSYIGIYTSLHAADVGGIWASGGHSLSNWCRGICASRRLLFFQLVQVVSVSPELSFSSQCSWCLCICRLLMLQWIVEFVGKDGTWRLQGPVWVGVACLQVFPIDQLMRLRWMCHRQGMFPKGYVLENGTSSCETCCSALCPISAGLVCASRSQYSEL